MYLLSGRRCLVGEEWDGMAATCKKCAMNTFKNVVGNIVSCDPCPMNSVTLKNGSTSCGKCIGT